MFLLLGLLSILPIRASQIFNDDFENFDPANPLGQKTWLTVGPATKSNLFAFLSTYSVELAGQAGGVTLISKSFPTPDLTGVTLSYYRRTNAAFGSGDFFLCDWFDGTNWNNIETLSTNVSSWTVKNFTLPAAAANNPKLQLRFYVVGANQHNVYVDRVTVSATYTLNNDSEIPHVTNIGQVKPNILQVSMTDRRVIPGAQIPYVAQTGDVVNPTSDPHNRWLYRDQGFAGTVIKPSADTVWLWDIPTGIALDTISAGVLENYTLSSTSDPHYYTSLKVHPTAVYRKSKPNDYARTSITQTDVTMQHELYLHLPYDLVPGNYYALTINNGSGSGDYVTLVESFLCSPSTQRSPAVHVSQVGFHPTDSAKVAFLSTWMGDGGKLDYTAGAAFQVLDNSTGAVVFNGTTTLQKAYNVTEINSFSGAKNTNKTNVYQMDFSWLTTPGTYRVYVPSAGGCSYPFTIGNTAWQSAFLTSVKALYYKRSGVALSTTYGNYNRPRDHHPADPGVVIQVSSKSLLDTSNGLDTRPTEPTTFVELASNVIPNQTLGTEAWGGYHDGGDWDRRIQHLEPSIWLLTFAEEFPNYFTPLSLNIPESGGSYPDVIDEALFNLDFYKRLQIASGPDAGAVRGGIEHDEHPRIGEAGWQDSNLTFAYAPDPWSSYWYAGTAGMMSYWFYTHGYPTQGLDYLNSALAAYNWAKVQNLANYQMGTNKGVTDLKNFAAASLFRLTGNMDLHADFVATTDFANGTHRTYEQRLGSWLYVRTVRDGMNPNIKTFITNSYIADADMLVAGCNDTGFRWTILSDPLYYYGLGTMSTSVEAPVLVKAHLLTGNATYLNTLILTCQTGLGANPDNRVYTSGLGLNPVKRPLNSDSRNFRTMPTPLGLTTLGPADVASGLVSGAFTPYYYPANTSANPTWPIIETYHDAWLDPFLTEYTVQSTILQSYVAWGYLAALHH